MLAFPTISECEQLLAQFSQIKIAVFGDFFLDEYLAIDSSLEERSLETGLPAHQVVQVRSSPGAAGTVAKNLAALGIGEIWAIGAIGNDGRGFELARHLENLGVRTDNLLRCENRSTPTYTKPCRIAGQSGRSQSANALGTSNASLPRERSQPAIEMERLDILHRAEFESDIVQELLARLDALAGQVNGVAALDQVATPKLGLIQQQTRNQFAAIAARHDSTIFLADSRGSIGEFESVVLKANRQEICSAGDPHAITDLLEVAKAARKQCRRTGKPVFATCGEDGLLVCLEHGTVHVPAVPASVPIDVTGAGDTATATLLSTMCAGANPIIAAVLANVAASISIEQIGETGVATAPAILSRLADFLDKARENPQKFALKEITS